MKKILLPLFALFAVIVNISFAQTPRTLSYQGVLTDPLGNPKPDGQYNIIFRLYFNETGGITQWTESKFITAAKGLFSTLLGDSVVFPSSMKWDAPYWISIQVDAGNELAPRIKLATTAYSFRAIIADNAVTVFDGAITSSKLAPNSVTSTAIGDGSVQMSDIAQAGATTGQAIVWNGSQWSPATVSSGGSFTAGAGIGIAGNVISNTGDLSNTNEIQNISLAGNQLSLSNGGGSVTLPGGGGTTYTAGAGINIAGNVISNTGDLSNTNEIQALSLVGNQLSLSNGGGSVTLPAGGGTNYWNASGSNISNNNNGNVGIGTPSPQVKLHIDGDGQAFRIDGQHPWMELWDNGMPGGFFRSYTGNIEMGTLSGNNNGYFSFWSGGSEAMRLTKEGRLGIGTASPQVKLHVNADGQAFRIDGQHPWMELWDNGMPGGFFRSYTGNIEMGTLSGNNNGSFAFWSGGKEAMRISSNGLVGIGTSIPNAALDVKGPTLLEKLWIPSEAGKNWSFEYLSWSEKLLIRYDGQNMATINNITGAWAQWSDQRLKKDILPYPSVLDGVMRLNVCTYRFKNQTTGTTRSLGLIAQDVRHEFPELVTSMKEKNGEEFYGISYAETGVIALKAIQEQQVLIEKLTRRVEELEKRLSEK